MSNPFFQFKKFTIYQDRSAMKVCTDACLFGAYIADGFKNNSIQNILDIGAGTGLLSLMLAQKLDGKIEALEIDEHAYRQASGNISNSPWPGKIRIFHADVKQFDFADRYDLIISNPPFYENDLRADTRVSNMARHDETLTIATLLSIAGRQLSDEGSFAVMIPYHRLTYVIDAAENHHLFASTIVDVKQSPAHNNFRNFIVFKKQPVDHIERKELVIKDQQQYTDEFSLLLKDYYLNL